MKFEESYQKLNPEQKEAVDAIEGPVMVVAGPGTGKTQILTLRIANILKKTDTKPEQILALTFTEAAAHNMRRRLAELIGNPAYRVVINTFHGFCNDIIKKYPEDFPRIIGSKNITQVDQVAIVESIIDKGEESRLVLLRPWGDRYLYVRDILKAISDLKREGITPDNFIEMVNEEKKNFANISDLYHEKGAHKGKMKGDYQKLERKISKNEELGIIYLSYQNKLSEMKQYDFDDMILEVLGALHQSVDESNTLLQMLQEEHQYILVDEHQDTNNAQNKIVEKIMSYHDHPNLFVVGDGKQAIFRFQGASLDNFQYFRVLYPSARLVTLRDNYRSHQKILDAAENLLPSEKTLRSAHEQNESVHPIRVGEFSTEGAERYFVVNDIKEKIREGVSPEEIAILYRNNKNAFPVARDLDKAGIEYVIESDQDIFSQSDVRKLLLILEAISSYGNDVLVTPLLHLSLFNIDPLDCYKILKAAALSRSSVFELISNKEILNNINLTVPGAVGELGEKLKRWVKESRESELLPFLEHIVRESGLLEDAIKSGNTSERFDVINSLFDEVRALVEIVPTATLSTFFSYLETVKKHKLFLKRKTGNSSKSHRVRLMTVHRSKGLEFSHVYIIGAIDGIFGGKIEREKLPLIDTVYK